MEGDRILLCTHLEEVRLASARRLTRVERVEDGVLLARCTTQWAYISTSTGRPVRMPDSVVDAFMREVMAPRATPIAL